jgi:replicative DNA helicase
VSHAIGRRVPPHDLRAEESLLGAMLLSNDARTVGVDRLGPGDFYKPAHGHIFDTIARLHHAGEPVDPVTVAAELERAGLLEVVGGPAVLVDLQAATPATSNAGRYATIVAEHAQSRQALADAGEIALAARSGDTAAAAAVARALADDLDTATRWDEPIPLGRASQRLPAFPVDVFPDWAGEFVTATAEATQTPVDLAAALVLSALATAAGGRAVVEVRAGWREPLNLYTATALPPGARKTPVFNRVTVPLTEAEEAAITEARTEIAEADARRRAALADAARAQQDADNASDDARDEAVHFAAHTRLMAEAITVPTMPRLLADDITPESLASLMAEQGGRIAILSDEGDVFSMMAGRYSKSGGPNLAVYLKGHAGSRLRVDRKSRDPEYIKAPALTLGLAVQPAVIESLSNVPGARGLGLLARFLFAIPPSNVGHRKVGAPPVPDDITKRYEDELVLLVQSLAEWTDPAVIVFTPDADHRLLAFEADLEPRLAPHGDLGHITDWASKLAGHTVRIAGLLHLAHNVRSGWGYPIHPDTVDAATTVARYYTAHALAVFDLIGADPNIARARMLVDWIRARQGEAFTRRDIHQAHRASFPKAADIDPVLELLTEHAYIRPRATDRPAGRGRPASPPFDINPHLA